MPNWSQLSGAVDRIVLVGLTWLASKGYIGSGDVTVYAPAALLLLGTIYSLIVNRATNLAKQAAQIPGTTVVTSEAIATATPQYPNIVSTGSPPPSTPIPPESRS